MRTAPNNRAQLLASADFPSMGLYRLRPEVKKKQFGSHSQLPEERYRTDFVVLVIVVVVADTTDLSCIVQHSPRWLEVM